MDNKSPFTVLRKSGLSTVRAKTASGNLFYFALKVDDYGSYVETCDHKKKIVSLDETRYDGVKGETLHLYNQLVYNRQWQIEWGKDEERLYLEDYPRLVNSLLACDNILTPTGELVQNRGRLNYLK